MLGIHDIYMGSEIIGQAEVTRRGLYYHFRCELSGEVLYRLSVCCNDHHENLGTLIPMDEKFGLDAKLSVRRLGEGKFQFRALPKHQKCTGEFVAVYPDSPFVYLKRLQNAYMQQRDGQVGIMMPSEEP